jgi:hypothetical protein
MYKSILTLFAGVYLIPCAGVPVPVYAQTDIPVLVNLILGGGFMLQ